MDHLTETRLQFGLSERIANSLRETFARYPQVRKAVMYGSRAAGNHRAYSDIDIAVIAPAMQAHDFSALWNELDDLPILFRLDVVHFDRVNNPRLRQNILNDGVDLYPAPNDSES